MNTNQTEGSIDDSQAYFSHSKSKKNTFTISIKEVLAMQVRKWQSSVTTW